MHDFFRVFKHAFVTFIFFQTISFLFSSIPKKGKAKKHNESTRNTVRDTDPLLQHQQQNYLKNLKPRVDVASGGVDVASAKFDTIYWPKIKDKLCPNMVPNVELAQTQLFHLARERMELTPEYEYDLMDNREGDDIYQRFYDFRVGLYAFSSKADNDADGSSSNNNSTTGKIKYDDDTFGYVPIWKCANQQLRFAMEESLAKEFDMEFIWLHMIPKSARDDICLVTAIRDPILHFLSGYNEIETRFVDNPGRHKHFQKYIFSRYEDGSIERFEMFVSDLLSGMPLEIKRYPFYVVPLAMPHVYLMSGILVELARLNMTLTAYLPSLHNLTYHWPQFVASMCPNVTFPAGFGDTPLSFTGQHESSGDKAGFYGAAKSVWHDGGATAQALCILHIMDYACFDSLEIPPLCRDVYNDKDFIRAIFSNDFAISPRPVFVNSSENGLENEDGNLN